MGQELNITQAIGKAIGTYNDVLWNTYDTAESDNAVIVVDGMIPSRLKNMRIKGSSKYYMTSGSTTTPAKIGAQAYVIMTSGMEEKTTTEFGITLYGKDDKFDVADFASGKIRRQFGIYQFTGKETNLSSTAQNSSGHTVFRWNARITLPVPCSSASATSINVVACSHYTPAAAPSGIGDQADNTISLKDRAEGNGTSDIRVCDPRFSDLDSLLGYFEQQYNNGTPVTVAYVVNPYDEDIPNAAMNKFKNLKTFAGYNRFNFSSEGCSIEYWKPFFCKEYVDFVTASNDNIDSATLGFVTPQMFGGYGDGLHDDSKAIKSCIDYATATNMFIIMGKTYRIGTPITLTSDNDNIRLDINKLIYTGDDGAIVLHQLASGITVNVKEIDSNANGVVIRYDVAHGIMRDLRINVSKMTVKMHGYYTETVGAIGDNTSSYSGIHYNEYRFSSIYAGENYACVAVKHNHTSGILNHQENKYYGGKCDSGAWAAYGDFDNEVFTGFVCESGINGGVYALTGGCSLIDWRAIELQDRYQKTMIKSDQSTEFFVKGFSVALDRLDFTNANPNLQKRWGGGAKIDRVHLSLSDKIDKTDTELSATIPIGTGCFVGTDVIVKPFCNQSCDVIIPEFNVGVYDTNNMQSSANFGDKHYKQGQAMLYTRFVAKTNTTINLPASYGLFGIEEFVVVQEGDNKAIIKDHEGKTVFDGTNLDAGTWVCRCYENRCMVANTGADKRLSYIWQAYNVRASAQIEEAASVMLDVATALNEVI